jgi:tight adherence protein B
MTLLVVVLAGLAAAAGGGPAQARVGSLAGRARGVVPRPRAHTVPGGRRLRTWFLARAGRRRADSGLADGLAAAARSLRAGAGLHPALLVVGGLGRAGESLAELARQAGRGRPLAEVASSWADGAATPSQRAAGAAVALAASGAAAPVRALETVASSLRDRAHVAAEVRAQAAAARLSAGVVAALPVAFVALLAVTDPSALAFLAATTVGRLCLAIGVLLEVAGVAWMAAIVGSVR